MVEYLKGRGCVECGENDLRVLDFDHVRGKKEGNVSVMVGYGVSWERLSAELAKCEIRCANCHRKRTAAQFGWWQTRAGT
ncbi:MAG: hypothetical protein WAN39_13065 [Candidatus Cybelea sp.]